MLLIQEQYVMIEKDSKGEEVRRGGGDSGINPYESCFNTASEAYKGCMKAYGRCVSKVYVDEDGKSKAIGWVFVKRRPYEDDRTKTFLSETWVTLHTAPPVRSVQHNYLYV